MEIKLNLNSSRNPKVQNITEKSFFTVTRLKTIVLCIAQPVPSTYLPIYFCQKLQTQTLSTEKLQKHLNTKKLLENLSEIVQPLSPFATFGDMQF